MLKESLLYPSSKTPQGIPSRAFNKGKPKFLGNGPKLRSSPSLYWARVACLKHLGKASSTDRYPDKGDLKGLTRTVLLEPIGKGEGIVHFVMLENIKATI